eukprot:scaffold838_cov251-Pinguiococcus_pyrenoidosus.AAC.2
MAPQSSSTLKRHGLPWRARLFWLVPHLVDPVVVAAPVFDVLVTLVFPRCVVVGAQHDALSVRSAHAHSRGKNRTRSEVRGAPGKLNNHSPRRGRSSEAANLSDNAGAEAGDDLLTNDGRWHLDVFLHGDAGDQRLAVGEMPVDIDRTEVVLVLRDGLGNALDKTLHQRQDTAHGALFCGRSSINSRVLPPSPASLSETCLRFHGRLRYPAISPRSGRRRTWQCRRQHPRQRKAREGLLRQRIRIGGLSSRSGPAPAAKARLPSAPSAWRSGRREGSRVPYRDPRLAVASRRA